MCKEQGEECPSKSTLTNVGYATNVRLQTSTVPWEFEFHTQNVCCVDVVNRMRLSACHLLISERGDTIYNTKIQLACPR